MKKKAVCNQCGQCCKLFLINLSKEEYKSGKYKTQLAEFGTNDNFKEASACGANILAQNKDGSCIYLQDNKCAIHLTRPQVCRNFFCNSKATKFKTMITQINKVKFK